MIFEQRIANVNLTTNEEAIVQYILENKLQVLQMSTRDIAKATYTSSSTVVRLSQKLGYQGFENLKESYHQELRYQQTHFQNIDANLPFNAQSTDMEIAGIMATLMKETAADTLALFSHDNLQKAVQILLKAEHIYIYTMENHLYLAELFKFKMLRINRHAIVEHSYGNQVYSSYLATPKDCAIVISYSGEIKANLEKVRNYVSLGIPTIAITSIGDNSLRNIATVALDMTTREKLHSKIAGFTTEYSIELILNTLYSCVYANDYTNASKSIERTKRLETTRFSTYDPIKE